MTATVTGLVATWNTTTGTHTATGNSVTNDLIVIFCGNSAIVTDPTVTDNDGGTYTQIGGAGYGALLNTSADKMFCFVRTALVASGKSTIYSCTGASSTGGGLFVFRVAGMKATGASAVRAYAKQENQAAGTPAPVLPQAALTTNALLCGVMDLTNGTANCAPRVSPAWTEPAGFDLGYTQTAHGFEAQFINSGEVASTITLGAATPSAFASFVVELTVPIAYSLASTKANVTFGASNNTTQKALHSVSTAPAITFGSSSDGMGRGVKLSSAVANVTFGGSSNAVSKALHAVSTAPSMTFAGTSDTTTKELHATSTAPNMSFGGSSNSTMKELHSESSSANITFGGSENTTTKELHAIATIPEVTFGTSTEDTSIGWHRVSEVANTTFLGGSHDLVYTPGAGANHYTLTSIAAAISFFAGAHNLDYYHAPINYSLDTIAAGILIGSGDTHGYYGQELPLPPPILWQ